MALTPVSSRRRQWAAEIDFRISLSPEECDDSPSRSETILLPKVMKNSSDCSLDLSTGAELSPGRSSISCEATWPLSSSDCEGVSPDVLAPSARAVSSSVDDKSGAIIEQDSCLGQQLVQGENYGLAIESKDESCPDEFSFTDLTREPESVASDPSPLHTDTSRASSFNEINCNDVSSSSDADEISIDTAGTLESVNSNAPRQLKTLQRTAGDRMFIDRRTSKTGSIVESGKGNSRPSASPTSSKLPIAADRTVAVAVQGLPFSERSKVWAEQREQRLQRLRDIQLDLIRSGTSKSTPRPQSSRRDASPKRILSTPSTRLQTLYARDQAWLERKQLREKELREAAFQNEVRECTFRPATLYAPTPRGTMTPDRARQLFDRQVSWKQRLTENSEWKRREIREASERSIKELRRSASADAVVRMRSCRSKSPSGRGALDVDGVFSELIERNLKWKRARDARIEQLQENALTQQLQSAEQVHSSRTKMRGVQRSHSCELGGGHLARDNAPSPALDGSSEVAKNLALTCTSVDIDVEHPKVELQMRRSISMNSIPGQPVRAFGSTGALSSHIGDSTEHLEVMTHLQSLQRCLRSSQSCNTGTWQRTVRVAAARISGAGAAPLRSASAHSISQLACDAPGGGMGLPAAEQDHHQHGAIPNHCRGLFPVAHAQEIHLQMNVQSLDVATRPAVLLQEHLAIPLERSMW
eukprot:CAMPEP_0169127218 /NCGR_PEP_ID=MMETSP1015-20121227/35886_1 /TAXON_ID=342587 /ORGANISM="Karlodinium micrum, Strain CCMP2283" /LENGTH=700 /DNA_ID=CAMNT_0009190977 /DNA_START=64 /DNA_END=2165 /DNA_ORIENTATION=+